MAKRPSVHGDGAAIDGVLARLDEVRLRRRDASALELLRREPTSRRERSHPVAGPPPGGEAFDAAVRLRQPDRGVRGRRGSGPNLSATRSRTWSSSFRARELAGELEQRLRALGLAPLRLVEPGVDEGDAMRDRRAPRAARRSSASNWSSPSFEMTITPTTRAPTCSGTASSDSSISAVPSIFCRELAVRGVGDEERLARLRDPTGHAAPDPGREQLDQAPGSPCHQFPAEGDRQEILAVADEDAAVVVVDQAVGARRRSSRRSRRRRSAAPASPTRSGASSAVRSSARPRRVGSGPSGRSIVARRRRRRRGSSRAPWPSSSRPPRTRRARAGSPRGRARLRARSRRSSRPAGLDLELAEPLRDPLCEHRALPQITARER